MGEMDVLDTGGDNKVPRTKGSHAGRTKRRPLAIHEKLHDKKGEETNKLALQTISV